MATDGSYQHVLTRHIVTLVRVELNDSLFVQSKRSCNRKLIIAVLGEDVALTKHLFVQKSIVFPLFHLFGPVDATNAKWPGSSSFWPFYFLFPVTAVSVLLLLGTLKLTVHLTLIVLSEKVLFHNTACYGKNGDVSTCLTKSECSIRSCHRIGPMFERFGHLLLI